AIAHGVTQIDTARAYGESEAVLNEALRGAWRSRTSVITKLDTLESVAHDAEAEVVQTAVDRSIAESCQALGTKFLPVLLLHRSHHRTDWNGTAWKRLLELKAKGSIGVLGVSVYDPGEALAALLDPDVQHLQIPMNILDWRWKANKVDRAIASRPDVVVHARSAFLQGLLLHSWELWPRVDYDASACVDKLKNLAHSFKRENVADLCVAYLRSQKWITSIVIGCETSAQLQQNLELFRKAKLTSDQCDELENSLPKATEALLNPSKWKVNHAQLATR
ncbi:MAG TPA: aldo/keto reductase, partial [Terriglobales bacterium]|nr:aldo/keto reductase [Terriglobales bacterium]